MFRPADKEYIISKIGERLLREDTPRQVLTTPFIGTSFADALVQGNSLQMLKDAVRICINDGWSHVPMWMELLLDIYQLRLIDARIAAIWQVASVPPPPAADPLNFTILNNDIPFVNRRDLRTRLRDLETSNARLRPILVVNGEEKSGKTYSTNYIDHFSVVRDSIITYSYSIEPGMESEVGPLEVARDLVLYMGGSPDNIPQPDTNLKRYTNNLALWVLNAAAKISNDPQRPEQQHWFILDNFNSKTWRPETREFIIALSSAVTKGLLSHKCRLIIIGFDRALLQVEPGKIDEEIIAACTSQDIDIAIDEILQRTPTVVGPPFRNWINNFIKEGLPPDRERMPEVNKRLRILLYAISRLTVILANLPDVDFEAVLRQMLQGLPGAEAEAELKKRLIILQQSKNEL